MGTCASKPAVRDDAVSTGEAKEYGKRVDGDCDTPMGGSHGKHTPFESVTSNGHRSHSWKTELGSTGDSAFHLESAQHSSSDNSSNLEPATACEGRETSAAPSGMEQEEELSSVLRGDRYEAKRHGPPKPPCNAERVAAVHRIDLLDEPPDPKLDHLLTLANTVFRTDIALCTLLDSDRIYISSSAGGHIPPGAEVAWKNLSMCGWVLTPDNHEVLVVEDMHCDARFHDVCLPGFERSYCGAPMVSSDGHRLGTFCVGGKQPRKFKQSEVAMLANMSEMAVREIEASHVAARIRRQEALLLRAVDALTMPFLIVDTSKPKWDVSYVNGAACELVGVPRNTMLQRALWDYFRPQAQSSGGSCQEPWKLYEEQVRNGEEFTLWGMSLLTPSSAPTTPTAAKSLFTLSFRPAGTDILDEHTIPIGVPAYVGGDSQWQGQPYYVVKMEQTMAILDHTMWQGSPQPSTRVLPFEDLKLGPILGKGSFGRVYRGIYSGNPVAVKVMDDNKVVRAKDGVPLEAVITGYEAHPSIVKCLGHATTCSSSPGAMHDSAHSRIEEKGEKETWLLLEYCDRGSVSDAVNKGWFRKTPVSRDQPPDMEKVIDTALEIANGMAYLHARGIVHGDLTGGNVLLCSDPNNSRGFVAKVADFGMARVLDVDDRIQTRMYGTITHMPPERLSCHVLDKNTDKYAFGVLLWEMAEGVRAWAGLTHAQILNTVAIQKRQLHLSEGLPCAFVELVGELLSVDPKQRPSFEAVKQKLEAIKAAGYQGQTSLCRSSLVRPSCGMPAPIPAIQEEVVSA